MLRHTKLEHKFVHYIPELLEPGLIYISMDYATAAHACCCGCGEQVITPFTPTDWKLTFDGETISLWPSIGNWNFHCRSHYIIRKSQVLGAAPWDEKKRKQKYNDEGIYHEKSKAMPPHSALGVNILGLWDRIRKKDRRR